MIGLALIAPDARAQESQPPAVVALVIDTSGSLTRADLERTRTLTLEMLENLPQASEVAVFTFDDQARLVLPRTRHPEEVRQALDRAAIAGRFTALNDALYDASRYLHDAPSGRKAIVLVTDGLDENSALNLDDALKVAEDTPIPVFAVGVGRVQERVLRRIAKLTTGEYLSAPEATGSLIASRILAIPAPAGSSPAAAAPAAPAPATTAARAAPVAAAPAPETSHALWAVLGLAVLAAVVLGALGLQRRARPRCETCGRELPGPLSACRFCAAAPGAETAEEAGLASGELSGTVIARMDLTEEYLEKTVTLREQPALAVTSGPGAGVVFNLNSHGTTSVGRAKANDIVLEDVSISSQHCRIRPENGRFVLHDLKSTNGTFVNERRVTRHRLSEGDVIKVGETYLQFRMNQRKA